MTKVCGGKSYIRQIKGDSGREQPVSSGPIGWLPDLRSDVLRMLGLDRKGPLVVGQPIGTDKRRSIRKSTSPLSPAKTLNRDNPTAFESNPRRDHPSTELDQLPPPAPPTSPSQRHTCDIVSDVGLSEDLAIITNQEQRLHFPTFNEESAWKLGCRLRDMALARSAPLVIDIRRSGQPLFFSALVGSSPDNADWARRKSNVVARFHRSSYGLGLELQGKNTSLADRFGLMLTEFAAHGGSFPITVVGSGVIGSVAVSGLPQRADHELVVEALCAELNYDYAELKLPAD